MNESTQFHRLSRLIPGIAVLALTFLIGCSGGGTRDYVLVIDTSGSMSTGRQKTIQKVRQSMDAFMKTVNPGDTVTLFAFDEQTRKIGSYKINSEADRAAPVAAVQNLDALGPHTYMKSMVSALHDTVQDLEGKGRNVIVVIMSDGKDDPPPGERNNRLQLSSIQVADEGGYAVNDTFIYYVSLGKLKDPELEAELKKLSPAVKTIQSKPRPVGETKAKPDAGKTGATANGAAAGGDAANTDAEASQDAADEIGLSEVADDIQTRSRYEKAKSIGKIVAPILFGILLLIWLIRKWRNRHKVSGNLQYYEADVGAPIKNNYNLEKTQKSAIQVGSKLGADLRVRQSGLPYNVTLRAYHKGGEDFLKAGGKDAALFNFMTRQKENLISKGDKFRLGNYVFEYSDGEK